MCIRDRGWRVTSVDLLPRFLPTICADVMDLDVTGLGDVDMMWASLPCTHYSRARSCAKTPRDSEGSDRMVQKCLDIAAQLGCPRFMEIPQTGMLKGRAVVAGIPYRIVDYCKYHDHRCTHRAHGDLDKHGLDAEQAALPQGLRALRGQSASRLRADQRPQRV